MKSVAITNKQNIKSFEIMARFIKNIWSRVSKNLNLGFSYSYRNMKKILIDNLIILIFFLKIK